MNPESDALALDDGQTTSRASIVRHLRSAAQAASATDTDTIFGRSPDAAKRPLSLWRQRAPQPNVVSILGERGTGKTTLLCHAVRAFSNAAPGDTPSDKPLRIWRLPVIDAVLASASESFRYLLIAGLYHAVERHQFPDEDQSKDNGGCRASLLRDLNDVGQAMAADDPGWRALSQSFSVGAADFGQYARERAESRLLFAEKLDTWLARALGQNKDPGLGEYDLALLPIDDFDLAPGRTADLLQVLGELQYVRRLVVVCAGDLEDVQARMTAHVYEQMGFQAAHSRAVGRPKAENIAEKMIAKVIPMQWRTTLLDVSPWFRGHFGDTVNPGKLTKEVDDPRQSSLGRLLISLGAATGPQLLNRSSRIGWFTPRVAPLLPSNLRRLAQLRDALVALWERPAAAMRAQEHYRTQVVQAHQDGGASPDLDSETMNEFQLAHPPKVGWVSAQTASALATLAEFDGRVAWGDDLREIAHAGLKFQGSDEERLAFTHVDFDRAPPDTERSTLTQVAAEVEALAQAWGHGAATERWFPPRAGMGLEAHDGAAVPRPSWLPWLIDLTLTYAPQKRAEFAARWWVSKSCLSRIIVNVGVNNGRGVASEAPSCSLLDAWRAAEVPRRLNDTPAWPIGAGLADLLDLVHFLCGLPGAPIVLTIEPEELASWKWRFDRQVSVSGGATEPAQRLAVAGALAVLCKARIALAFLRETEAQTHIRPPDMIAALADWVVEKVTLIWLLRATFIDSEMSMPEELTGHPVFARRPWIFRAPYHEGISATPMSADDETLRSDRTDPSVGWTPEQVLHKLRALAAPSGHSAIQHPMFALLEWLHPPSGVPDAPPAVPDETNEDEP